MRIGNARIRENKFEQCIFDETDFAESDVSECNFRGSDFKGARFVDTNLQKADFQHAINYQIDPLTNKLKGAKFSLPEAIGMLTGLGIVIVD